MKKKRIALISPNSWDAKEIEARTDRYEFIPYGPGFQKEKPSLIEVLGFFLTFDVHRFIDKAVEDLRKLQVDAILGTDEYLSSVVAAIIAKKLGLPAAEPEAILVAQSKFHSRILQKKVCPECIPEVFELGFQADNPRVTERSFPLFVKPVRGASSLLAREVSSLDELRKHVGLPLFQRFLLGRLLKPYEALLDKYTQIDLNSEAGPIRFVAETPLRGVQVTLEGYAYRGEVSVLGIVDSVMYPGSRLAFERFEYPSRLSPEIQSRIASLAKRLIHELGLGNGMFNIEFFYNPATDQVRVIEINPRLSFQFTDLFERVDGLNTYDIQIELSLGNRPEVERIQSGNFSASFVLRVFRDGQVVEVPSPVLIDKLEKRFDARIHNLVSPGNKLSSDFLQDTESFRYAIVNMSASTREELFQKFEKLKSELNYRFRFFSHQESGAVPERENATT